MSPPVPTRRRGALPIICACSAVSLLSFDRDALHFFAFVVTASLRVALFGPMLACCIFLLFSYTATCCARPNTLRVGWVTAAYVQGLGAALFVALSSPLLTWLVDVLQLQIGFNLPAINFSVPTNLTWHLVSGSSGMPVPELAWSRLEVSGAYVSFDEAHWWVPALAITSLATAVWLVQSSLSFLATGRGATPAVWRHTTVMTNVAEIDELRAFVAAQCTTQRGKYQFGMEMHEAWKVWYI